MFDESRAPIREDLVIRRADAQQEIERLHEDCAEAYQGMGCVLIGDTVTYSDCDAEWALENISGAAHEDLRAHEGLVPRCRAKFAA